MIEINSTSEYILHQYPRGKDFDGMISNSCNIPFYTLNIDLKGECYICHCESWLPISVGNILDFDSLEDIWSSKLATILQDTVSEKKFTYCAVEHCGIATKEVYIDRYQISLNIDESCNLACPSCRPKMINYSRGNIFEKKQQYINHFLSLLDKFPHPLELTMCGNGDPIASLIFRPLILHWMPKINQTVKLFTNGLLMKKILPKSSIYPHINKYQISVDAGSKEVYENVRRPGKFEILQENLEWLSKNIEPNITVHLMFCLQKSNASDIINFSNMCQQYGCVGNISKLDNWATFDNFNDHDVVDNTSHPLHKIAFEQLNEVKTLPHILLNNYLKMAMSRYA
jgi:MoaA/NifB/PqqE/SkfB family radical SAM enzyme